METTLILMRVSAPEGKIREELANREPDVPRLLEDSLPGKVTGGEGLCYTWVKNTVKN